MKTIVVRYQVKPERAEENQGLVEAVFAELATLRPGGFAYLTMKLEDGVSFIHIVFEFPSDDHTSLQDVPAFQRFVAEVGDRCAVAPVAMSATVVGNHQALAPHG